jgi:hypothetical protein
MSCCQPCWYNRQHADVVGCSAFRSVLISGFVFDILHILNGFIRLCSVYIAPTCTPLAMVLVHARVCPHVTTYHHNELGFPGSNATVFHG